MRIFNLRGVASVEDDMLAIDGKLGWATSGMGGIVDGLEDERNLLQRTIEAFRISRP